MSSLPFSALSAEPRGLELIVMHAAARVMYTEDIKEKVMKIERGHRRARRELFDVA